MKQKLYQNSVFEESLHINKPVLLWGFFLAAGIALKEFSLSCDFRGIYVN